MRAGGFGFGFGFQTKMKDRGEREGVHVGILVEKKNMNILKSLSLLFTSPLPYGGFP